MTTREHIHQEVFSASPQRVFALLHTPSAIRKWWGAARAIVLAEPGGIWMAAWGDHEDAPDYITAATIREFHPPHQLVLDDYRYHSQDGPLPFEADFITRFTVSPHAQGASLEVSQAGFPTAPEADEFFAACQQGWRDTFTGIRQYLAESASPIAEES